MPDLLYIAGTVLFFAVMLAFVHACEALGRGTLEDQKERTP